MNNKKFELTSCGFKKGNFDFYIKNIPNKNKSVLGLKVITDNGYMTSESSIGLSSIIEILLNNNNKDDEEVLIGQAGKSNNEFSARLYFDRRNVKTYIVVYDNKTNLEVSERLPVVLDIMLNI